MAEHDQLHPHLDATPLSRVWSFELPEDFIEPDTTGGYSSIAPTPIANSGMNPWFNEVLVRQRAVSEAFRPLFDPANAPGMIPERVADMIQLDQMAGEAHRSTKNLYAYGEWCNHLPFLVDAPPHMAESMRFEAIEEEVSRAGLEAEHAALLMGTITPHEGLALLRGTSLPSCELTKVAHPYGYRMGYVSEARAAVQSAVVAHGGTMAPQGDMPYQKIVFQPHFDFNDRSQTTTLDGLLVTYKRPVGHVVGKDGRRINVIERQSAAIRVDDGATDLNPGLSRQLRQPLLRSPDDGSIVTDGIRPLYEDYFSNAIQHNVDANYLVPLSTMTYAARETEKEYQDRLQNQAESAHKIGRTGLAR